MAVLELRHQPVDDPLVPVVAAELGVPGGRLDLEDPLADLEQRHVEGPSAQVEDQDRLVVLLVEPVCQCGRRRLVDDPKHFEPGDLSGLVGGLALGVVEVRRDRDDRLGDLVAQVGLGVALQLPEDLRRDLLGRPLLAVDVHGCVLAPHLALDRTDRPVGVGDGLPLGDLPDHDLSGLGEPDDRWGGPRALRVRDHDRLAALQNDNHRVRGPQIDPNCTWHRALPPLLPRRNAQRRELRQAKSLQRINVKCPVVNFGEGMSGDGAACGPSGQKED